MKRTDPDYRTSRLVTVLHAAEWLDCSVRSVWNLIAQGRLTAIRLGRRTTRVDAGEIEALITAARAKSAK